MEVFILIGLILLNGAFAMAEIAVVSAKRGRLQSLAEQGNASAVSALKLVDEPTQFMSTVQIGITTIGIMNGIFGESVLAEPFADWLQGLGLRQATADPLATVLVVVVVTYLSIVVGELVPKRLGQLRAERIACIVARPMRVLALVAIPLVKILSVSTALLMHLFGFQNKSNPGVTEEDIHALLSEGSSTGAIEPHEHEIVWNVFRFDERPISSLMVPRSEMVYLDLSLSLLENYQRVKESPHSNFPLCDRQPDNLLGVINLKDVLVATARDSAIDLAVLAKPCTFVLPGMKATDLLQRFRVSNEQMAFIVDEYGDLKGLVTVHDLLEALIGDFYSQSAEDAYIITREDGSYLLDGLLPVIDVRDLLGLTQTLDSGYHTLSGLIMAVMEKVPEAGDVIVLEQWRLEIVDMDGRRIDKVLASRLDAIM